MSGSVPSSRVRWAVGFLALLVGLGVGAPIARADGVPPVTVQVREQESGRFLVKWRVPQVLPPPAIPSPLLPESCRAVGERSLTERPGAWFVRQMYDCPSGLSGQLLGIDFPMLNATVSTILRVELLSGDRYAHSFAPGETTWRMPDVTAGDIRRLYRGTRAAVLAGADHFLRNGVHWAFLAVLLLAAIETVPRNAAAFSGAQIIGVLVGSLSGLALAPPLAEIGVGTATALLAHQLLRAPAERRQLTLLAACAGLAHGLGLTGLVAPPPDYAGPSLLFLAVAVVGMDAALLLASLVALVVKRAVPSPMSLRFGTVAAYAAAVTAVALAIGLPASDVRAETGATTRTLQLPDLPIPEGSSDTPASRRVAAQFPDAAVQSFLTVAPFEVRHEVLVRLGDLAAELDLPATGTLSVEDLESVKKRLQGLLLARHDLTIDGRPVDPALTRTDFLTLDDRGVLPRPDPVEEEIATAWVGLTTAYLTPQTPQVLSLEWDLLEGEAVLPATITDPEATRSVELTARRPVLDWTNELSEDPTPIVTALAVDAPVAWIPVLSIIAAVLGIGLGLAAARQGRAAALGALARVTLAVACVLAPVATVAVPLPDTLRSVPDERTAHRILSRLLPNVYRAFEFPTESAVYDRLALGVTGDTLAQIYLEHRRSVLLEERGGARARVEAVELLSVDSVEPAAEDGFVADAVWTVGGTVTHFGHRHFRRNRYDARATVVPVDGTWKIQSIEIFDEQRLQ